MRIYNNSQVTKFSTQSSFHAKCKVIGRCSDIPEQYIEQWKKMAKNIGTKKDSIKLNFYDETTKTEMSDVTKDRRVIATVNIKGQHIKKDIGYIYSYNHYYGGLHNGHELEFIDENVRDFFNELKKV